MQQSSLVDAFNAQSSTPIEHYNVIAIVGSTSTGKTDLSIELVRYLQEKSRPAEIINADSFQLYKEMDIGTSKPSKETLREITHNQIDVLNVSETAYVAHYQKKARADLQRIRKENKVAIVVGGSGLYVKALLDKMSFFETNPKIRKRLTDLYDEYGVEYIYDLLNSKDPKAAESIEPQNSRRIIRALEVIEITNKPYAATLPKWEYFFETQSEAGGGASAGAQEKCLLKKDYTLQIGLTAPREYIDSLIDKRTQKMRDLGLSDEVKKLMPRLGQTSIKAIGYKELISAYNAEISEDEAYEQIKTHTKQLVRKQIAWFKRDTRINWFDIHSKNRTTPY
jgi:tRNA dimethylallyltransferase